MATRVEEAYTERDQKMNAKGKVVEVENPYWQEFFEHEPPTDQPVMSRSRNSVASGRRVR